MRWLKWIAVALVLTVLTGTCVTFRPDRALRVATGVVAHNVCSKSFVSGLDPQTVFSETIASDGLRRLRRNQLRRLLLRDVYADGLGRKVVVLVEESVKARGCATRDERAGF